MTTERAVLTGSSPAKDEIVYPESDGMPLPDGLYQFRYIYDILEKLNVFFDGDPRFFMSSNTFIYYEEGNPYRHVSPDCYIAFDVDVDSLMHFNTYRIWEVGKPPDFILEVGSPSTGNVDIGHKRELYSRLGVGEYWLFDPSGGDHYGEPLVGLYLVDGEYRRLEARREPDGTLRIRSPFLKLDFSWRDGRLGLYDPVSGEWLKNAREVKAHAEAERIARESAEVRMAQMEAELRRLRGE